MLEGRYCAGEACEHQAGTTTEICHLCFTCMAKTKVCFPKKYYTSVVFKELFHQGSECSRRIERKLYHKWTMSI